MATTTTKLGDYLGRALNNDTPGTSNASDFLGRAVTGTDKDFAGRTLANTATYPPAVVARNTAYSVGDTRRIPGVKKVQTITPTGSPAVSFAIDVTLRGVTRKTAAITVVGLSSSTISAAIVALSNVEPGDIVVGGSGPYTLTYAESLGNTGAAVPDHTLTTGGTYPITTTTAAVVKGGIVKATTAGTTHSSNLITQPAVGASVTDGTAVWLRLK